MTGLEAATRLAIGVLVFGSTAVFVWFLAEVLAWWRSGRGEAAAPGRQAPPGSDDQSSAT